MVDVLVVGGGPVGMVTALGLARAGVSVRLIEAQPSLNESPRAAVYHWSVLDGPGADRSDRGLGRHCFKVRQVHLHRSEARASEFPFQCARCATTRLGLTIFISGSIASSGVVARQAADARERHCESGSGADRFGAGLRGGHGQGAGRRAPRRKYERSGW